ncbi:MAG: hypothetical protein GYA33_13135 [Thermogutta sp.]|nr:hypothetical protein [Thermogutta sp.]
MQFHFFCPTGHLLQADERHVGQAAVCPYCNTMLRIPPAKTASPAVDAAAPRTEFEDAPSEPPEASFDAAPRPEEETLPMEVASDEGAVAALREEEAADHRRRAADAATAERRSGSAETVFGDQPPLESAAEGRGAVHIPCPAGHVLETPQDMLGSDAMCPFCGQVFRLELRNSLEYRQEEEQRAAREAERAARFWLRCAIAAAIVTVGGLILLIVLTAQR